MSPAGRLRRARVAVRGLSGAALTVIRGRASLAYGAYPRRGRRGVFARSFSRRGVLGRARRLRRSGAVRALAAAPGGRPAYLLVSHRRRLWLQRLGRRHAVAVSRRGPNSRAQMGVDRRGRVYLAWFQSVGDCRNDAGVDGESAFARVVGRRPKPVRELAECSAGF